MSADENEDENAGKKDLTGISELSLDASSDFPVNESGESGQSVSLVASESEVITEFESLDELSKAFAAEVGEIPEEPLEEAPQENPQADSPNEVPENIQDELSQTDSLHAELSPPQTPNEPEAGMEAAPEDKGDLFPEQSPNELSPESPGSAPLGEQPPNPIGDPFGEKLEELPSEAASAGPSEPAPPGDLGALSSEFAESALAQPEQDPGGAQQRVPPVVDPMLGVKRYDEDLGEQKAATSLPASFPFSLLIEGLLDPADQEKLLDILSREKMGIREVDLEPQLAEGRILIPRISEFAGVLLVQAMRDIPARMKLGPSDSVFATEDTQSPKLHTELHPDQHSSSQTVSSAFHPAEDMPVTTQDHLPDHSEYTVIDTVIASASMRTHSLEAESSSEYQELLEALQRELKYKAFRKGAQAILNFSVETISLSLASHFRVLATGTAVRALSEVTEPDASPAPEAAAEPAAESPSYLPPEDETR